MKRTVVSFVASVCVAGVLSATLCACGSSGNGSGAQTNASSMYSVSFSATPTDSYKTMADVFAAESEDDTWSYTDDKFMYAGKINGSYVRVVAQLPEDKREALKGAPVSEEGVLSVIGDLPVSEQKIVADAATMDAMMSDMVGKTGKSLIDAGFVLRSTNVAEDGTASALFYNSPLDIQVTFASVAESDKNLEGEALIANASVESVQVLGVSTQDLEAE